MEEKSELNDIILNKSSGNGGNKKVLLAIAALAIVLIVVVVIMNRINSEGTQNLPQAILPPEPDQSALIADDPLFEPVAVLDDPAAQSDNLDKIAKKLKEESLSKKEAEASKQPVVIEEDDVVIVEPPQPEPVAKPAKKEPAKPLQQPAAEKGAYYVQVGSFSKYAPNKKFITSITDNGFSYTYHKVTLDGKTINKVLIGPFKTEKDARSALDTIRKKIEPGAFLTKV